jgi:translation initiation factor 3 subunit H
VYNTQLGSVVYHANISHNSMTQPEFDEQFIKDMEEEKDTPISLIRIDGLALLKIINHCTEKIPVQVSGALLGLNVKERLEISNCFPLPTRKLDEESMQFTDEQINEEINRYQLAVLKNFRDVNIDNNTIGWYQSTYMESFINTVTIDTQFSYQRQFGPKCCLIVFDPLRTRRSNLSVRALRLTEKFMEAVRTAFAETQSYDAMKKKYTKKTDSDVIDVSRTQFPESIEATIITQDVLTKLNFKYNDIFEEIPIEISNIHLVQSYLSNLSTYSVNELASTLKSSLVQAVDGTDVDNILSLSSSSTYFTPLHTFDSLDLSSAPFLERALESLIESSDYLTLEQNKYQVYQRRLLMQKQNLQKKKEKTAEELDFMIKSVQQPNQLDALMISNQIDHTLQSVNRFAAQSIDKLYLVDALMKSESKE